MQLAHPVVSYSKAFKVSPYTSRIADLSSYSEFISPSVMVPSRRLATLVDQARQHQQQSCLYHDDDRPTSLYVDHECSSGLFPSMTTHILADHSDEVWNIVWSPDGMMLASCGKDHTVVIWELKVWDVAQGMFRRDDADRLDCADRWWRKLL